MVEIGDKIILNEKPNSEKIGTEVGISPQIGDRIFVHKNPNGELITNGISNCEIGDTVSIKPLKDYLQRDVCLSAESGGDDTCLRGLMPTKSYYHEAGESIFGINGGWSFFFKLKTPMYVKAEQPFPLLYVTTYNRMAVIGEGEPPITDDQGRIISIPSAGDFQNWYPWGRLRFMFSEDNLPVGCEEKTWFCTDDFPPSILEIGDVTLNKDQNTYLYPDAEWGGWVWKTDRYITDIWIHVRNTSSFAWMCSGKSKVSRLRICYQSHPDYLTEDSPSPNLTSPDWQNCMIEGAEKHPEMTDSELMNFCNQYL